MVEDASVGPCNTIIAGRSLVKNVDDIIQLCEKFIQTRPLKWITSYFLFLHSIVVPVHPDTVRAIVSTPGVPKNLTFTGSYRLIKPFLGESVLLSNGPKWERIRRLLTSAFHHDNLKPYVKIFNEGTNIFVDNLKTLSNSKTSVNILPLITHLTLHNLLVCTFSHNDETLQHLGDQHPYVAALKRVKSILVKRYVTPCYLIDWIFNLSAEGKEFKKHCDYIHNFSEKIIRNRRQALATDKTLLKKRQLDFLDILLTAEDSDGLKLTDDEIRNEVETFMAGGHDTTASAISWALHSLAKHPEYQQRLREEVTEVLAGKQEFQPDDLSKLPFTTCVIKETLRMYSPAPAFEWLLHEPITIEGVDLMKGQSIYLIPHLLHHNPSVWEDHWLILTVGKHNLPQENVVIVHLDGGRVKCRIYSLNQTVDTTFCSTTNELSSPLPSRKSKSIMANEVIAYSKLFLYLPQFFT